MLPTEFTPLFLNNTPLADRAVMDSLHYPLQDCEEYFTLSPDEISARQQIFRDLLNDEPFYQAFCNAYEKLDELNELDFVKKTNDVPTQGPVDGDGLVVKTMDFLEGDFPVFESSENDATAVGAEVQREVVHRKNVSRY